MKNLFLILIFTVSLLICNTIEAKPKRKQANINDCSQIGVQKVKPFHVHKPTPKVNNVINPKFKS